MMVNFAIPELDDFIPLRSMSLIFTNSSRYEWVCVYIVDDGILDEAIEESFYLVLNSSDPAFGPGEVTVDKAQVTIIDTSGIRCFLYDRYDVISLVNVVEGMYSTAR